MARPTLLTPAKIIRLAELWETDVYRSEIAAELGVNEFTVSRWASALGLPPKPQPPKRRDTSRIAAANKSRRAMKEAEQVAKLDKCDTVTAKWWRCDYCQGKSTDREGHELCRNKRAA